MADLVECGREGVSGDGQEGDNDACREDREPPIVS
jgi:hypothetical protein